MKKYGIIDASSHYLRGFDTYEEACQFRAMNNRYDWLIISYFKIEEKSTPKQRSAVKFVEQVLDVVFKGNINSKSECSTFLDQYLEEAKSFYIEIKCEYETDRGY